jgi:hypothetical protein
MVCEEPIAPTAAMPDAMNKKKQSSARNRDDPDVPFGLEIMDAPEPLLYTKPHKSVNTWRFHVAQRAVRFAASCDRAPPKLATAWALEPA